MYAVAHQPLPGAVAYGLILLSLQVSLLDAPGHTVEEKRRARHLLAAIVGVGYQAGVPQSVLLALTVFESLAHQQEVFLQFLVVFVLRRKLVHAAHQGSIHPSVASAPVAVLAVGCLIGGHIVLVAPPETFLHVEEAASQCVTTPAVHLHGVVGILAVAGDLVHLHVEGHGHLDGVDPCPPAVQGAFSLWLLLVGCLHLLVEVFDDELDFLFAAHLIITVHVGLSAALVVGIVGLHAVAGCPFVERCPAVGIVGVARVGVNLIEGHQSFVVHGARP